MITETVESRRRALKSLEKEYIRTSDAPGMQRNAESRLNRYLEFCDFANARPFPTNEFKITKFAAFLADSMKTIQSIKTYCASICQQHELKGYKPIKLGLRYYKAIKGIRKELHHQPKKAEPLTIELLEKMQKVVNYNDDIEFVVWVALVTWFHLLLHKSNLVPLSRVHDTMHNIARHDVRYSDGVMIILIRWSKTNQFKEITKINPLMMDNDSMICPVRWILYMVDRINAAPEHNLFSF